METTSAPRLENQTKPSIVTVISQRVELRRSGKQYTGLCPFHQEKTPSFCVSEERGLFHCFGCQVGGDVIDFVMKLDGLKFKEAVTSLGMDGRFKPRPLSLCVRQASAKLAYWLNDQHLKCDILLRELSQKISIARQTADSALAASLTREWEILCDLSIDLDNPDYGEEFWKLKDSIESITQWAEPEPLPIFPPLTDEYRAYLRSLC